MPLTLTRIVDSEDVWGRTRVITCDVALDNSYPAANGYVINASDVGFTRILGGLLHGGNQAAAALLPGFDFGTLDGKPKASVALRMFYPTGGGNAAPGALADPAGTVPVGAVGVTSTAAQPPIGITPGRGKEVANTTDLSTISLRVQFFGF